MTNQLKARPKLLGRSVMGLRQQYKGWEDAIVEMIKNSLDAGCKRVWISVPSSDLPNAEERRVSVKDDGCGMAASDIEGTYLAGGLARSQSGKMGHFGRRVYGYRGTGKFSLFNVGRRIEVSTNCMGERSWFVWSISDVERNDDIADVFIQTETIAAPDGTEVTISDLAQGPKLAPPNLSDVQRYLVRYFIREPGVTFYVNDTVFNWNEHAEQVADLNEDLDDIGHVSGGLWRLNKPSDHAGVVVQLRGQRVFGPSLLDVDQGLKGQAKAEATRLVGSITLSNNIEPSDFEAWLMTTPGATFKEWLTDRVQATKNVSVAKALKSKVDLLLEDQKSLRIYRQLSTDRQHQARKLMEARFARSSRDVTADDHVLFRLLCHSLGSSGIHGLLKAIEESDDSTFERLTGLLEGREKWTLRQIVATAEGVRARLLAIDEFERLTADFDNNEKSIHQFLEEQPWIISDRFTSFRSNETLRTMISKIHGESYHGRGVRERPDLVFCLADFRGQDQKGVAGELLIVELKRPGLELTGSDLEQGTRYAIRLLHSRKEASAEVFLLGGRLDPDYPPQSRPYTPGTRYAAKALLYDDLIQEARLRFQFIEAEERGRYEQVIHTLTEIESLALEDLLVPGARKNSAVAHPPSTEQMEDVKVP